ncbi:hypothetical protein MLD38_026140 [Melastoma candidum]|uniref:Uncharacterized protein n=1 Tax=Melastoma candidum TaxID=119954 RepID=A0ACB9NXF1_9MYRT|nr:hypothetical protein MLD38_026140 [Melastoma candidum]
MEERRSHVLVVTYPAQGYINPLLQFAKLLAAKGIKTTFAITRYTIQAEHVPWDIDVARTFGISTAVFLKNSSAVCSLYWHIHCNGIRLPLAPEALPLTMPGLPPINCTDLPSFLTDPESQSVYLA